MSYPEALFTSHCPRCGSSNIVFIDYEFDDETKEDIPYGIRCETCGHIVSEHPYADIWHAPDSEESSPNQ